MTCFTDRGYGRLLLTIKSQNLKSGCSNNSDHQIPVAHSHIHLESSDGRLEA